MGSGRMALAPPAAPPPASALDGSFHSEYFYFSLVPVTGSKEGGEAKRGGGLPSSLEMFGKGRPGRTEGWRGTRCRLGRSPGLVERSL